jgi:hypothetical protein
VVGVSKMSAGNYMQERYNHAIHVTRQNKREQMQMLGVQKGGIVNQNKYSFTLIKSVYRNKINTLNKRFM